MMHGQTKIEGRTVYTNLLRTYLWIGGWY